MGRKTYILFLAVLTVAATLAFCAIALADGDPAAKTVPGGVATSTVPSLANNVDPAVMGAAGAAAGDTNGAGGAASGSAAGDTAASGAIKETGAAAAAADAPAGPAPGFILASNGIPPSTTIPSSGNTTTGAAAGMFGDPVHGLAVYSTNCMACHGTAGQPVLAFPGLADVQNPNPNFSIDPQLYDINPAWFAKNIDPFIQHGSNPAGPPAPMPPFGDLTLLSQSDIADSEAYVMSLSNVFWPRLSLSGSVLTGNTFVPGSTVQLYLNGAAFGSPIVIGAGGTFVMSLSLPATQVNVITANYAILNVSGIHANGSVESPELGLDADRGAALTVARATLGAAPVVPAVRAAVLPSTGFGLVVPFILAVLSILGGTWLLVGASKR